MIKEFRFAGQGSLSQSIVLRKTHAARNRVQGQGDGAVPAATEPELIFALDIGTRNVIGLVGRMKDDMLAIEAAAYEEHQHRAVVDGQIEDIRETAKVALKVKQQLEAKIGRSLTQVHIAAAGRVLRTGEAVFTTDAPSDQEIDAAYVAKMEFAAIQRVFENLTVEDKDHGDSFLCVGHSIVYYQLDGYAFSTLIGHKGSVAEVKVIATFLPKEVVDSLSSTMARIGLTIAGMTLEPIAAINAVIPADLRKLNLALVDIGAGTSDIAVCENGSVSAYTMATVAGDEVTEAIMEACLVDFDTAEGLKRKLGETGSIRYTNILGYEGETDGESLYQQIMPTIRHLVEVVGEKVSGVNKRPPAAVFLVGGGSQLPGLCAMVAKELGMEENRVAVGGGANMHKQATSDDAIFGPEYATPLGIAITAGQRDTDEAFAFSVNGETVPMLGVWEMTVLDALQLAGFKYGQIMGRAGRSLIYTVNGERHARRGGLPTASVITCNGNACALGDKIAPGDQILFEPAVIGADASLSVEEVSGEQDPLYIWVNGINYPVGRFLMVNGRPAEAGQHVRSMDVIRQKAVLTVEDLCSDLEINLSLYEIFVNDAPEMGDYALASGDYVETRLRGDAVDLRYASQSRAGRREDSSTAGSIEATSTAGSIEAASTAGSREAAGNMEAAGIGTRVALEAANDGNPGISIATADDAIFASATVNASPLHSVDTNETPNSPSDNGASAENIIFGVDGKPILDVGLYSRPITVHLNGKPLRLQPKVDSEPYCFFDMFSFVDIDTKTPHGDLIQTVNATEASYVQELMDGDEVWIYWSEDKPG